MSLRGLSFFGGMLLVGAVLTACEWTGGSDGGFNTSKIDFNVNISGVYNGMFSGGKAVETTTGGAITRFLIQQTGNALQVTDNNGQSYRGTSGAPYTYGNFANEDTLPAGASVASFQVSWGGTDGTAAKDIDFSGVINLITIEDVESTTTDSSQTQNQTQSSQTDRDSDSNRDSSENQTDSSSSDSDSSLNIPGGETEVIILEDTGNGTTNIVIITVPTPEQNFNSSQNSDTDSDDNRDSSSSVTQTQSQSSDATRDNSTTSSKSYSITKSGSQLWLQGTWIEQGGAVSNTEARSAGTAAIVTVDGGNNPFQPDGN